MPPDRHRIRHPATKDEPRTYVDKLGVMKGQFRSVVSEKFKELTGRRDATMKWSVAGYAKHVVHIGRWQLAGWPWYANIEFGNPSEITGGQPAFQLLLALWNVGILRFEPVDDELADLAKRNPKAVLPGSPPTRPPPFCWGPFTRNTMGLGRAQPVSNPLGLPRRRPKTGPKTPKLILDSDSEVGEDDDSEICSDLE